MRAKFLPINYFIDPCDKLIDLQQGGKVSLLAYRGFLYVDSSSRIDRNRRYHSSIVSPWSLAEHLVRASFSELCDRNSFLSTCTQHSSLTGKDDELTFVQSEMLSILQKVMGMLLMRKEND